MGELLFWVALVLVVLALVFYVVWIALALALKVLSVLVLCAVVTFSIALVGGLVTGVVVPSRLVRERASSGWRQITPQDVAAGHAFRAPARGDARHHGWDHAWPTYFPYQAREDVRGVLAGARALAARPRSWEVAVWPLGTWHPAHGQTAPSSSTSSSRDSRSGAAKQAVGLGGRVVAALPRVVAGSLVYPPLIGFTIGLWISTLAWLVLVVVVGGLAVLLQRIALGAFHRGDVLARRRARVQMRCRSCYHETTLPSYRCDGPGCTAVHHDLMPGPLGLLTRRCGCGATLPNTIRRAGARLRPVCPSCGTDMAVGSGNRQTIQVPVIGAQAAGKSRLLAAATVALDERLRELSGSVEPLGQDAETYLAAARTLVSRRTNTSKTAAQPPVGVPLLLRVPGLAPVELQIMDVGGERFADWNGTADLRYLDAADAVVVVVDPLALAAVSGQLGSAGGVGGLLVASGDQEKSYAAAVDRMRAENVPLDRRHLAVVLTKADVLVKLPVGAALADGADASVRSWMRDNGLDGMVRRCERDFRSVSYFALDSMSARTAGSSADPLRVLRWVLTTCRSSLATAMGPDVSAASPVDQPAGAAS